jgi:transcriptional regulator with PAS, ATPase and Fis domain
VHPTAIALPTVLDSRTLRLGRDEQSDVVLSGVEASREHALIRRDGPLSVLRDLGSRNGTFRNGVRVDHAPLAPGDVLKLGEWVAVVVQLQSERPAHYDLQPVAAGFHAGPALRAVLEPVQRAAKSDLSIVVVGETGTGKELVARAIHAWSGRSGPLIAVNCAALPAALAEAQLFGHRRGAFTGAEHASPGHFRAAEGGTLLLDELTDLPSEVQAKVLRVLEQREVLPLGESRPVPIDVRVVAAAQEPVTRAVAERRFRADLWARLDGLSVELPPLRARIEDVPLLFQRLLRESLKDAAVPAIEPQLIEALCLYDWPFNVRELRQLAQRLLVLHAGEAMLRRKHLPRGMQPRDPDKNAAGVPDARPPAEPASDAQRRERDLEALLQALREHKGNVARAAAAAAISRPRAYRLLNARPDLDLEELRDDAKAGTT